MARVAFIHASVWTMAALGLAPLARAADTCDQGYVPAPPDTLESAWGVRIKDFKGNDSARRIYMGVGSFPDGASRIEAVQGNGQRWQSGVRYRLTHTSRLEGGEVVQTLDVQMRTGPDAWEPAFAGVFPLQSRHPAVETSSAANGFKLELSARGQDGDSYDLRIENAVLEQAGLQYALGDLEGLCHGTTCTSDTRYYFDTGIDLEAPFELRMEFEYNGSGGKGERSRIQFGPVYMEENSCFACEDALAAADAERERAREDLTRALAERDEALGRLGTMEDEALGLRDEVSDLRAEVDRLQAQVAALTLDLTWAQTQLAGCEADLDSSLNLPIPECPEALADPEKDGRAVAAAAPGCTCLAGSQGRLGPMGGGLLLMGLLALRRRRIDLLG